jgi:hypothetical protein
VNKMSIVITQGDALSITLTCTGMDLTGATITTRFKAADPDSGDIVIANSAHTPDADQVTHLGKVVVALSAAETALMAIGTEQEIITKVVQGASVVHFHGKRILTVKKATLR